MRYAELVINLLSFQIIFLFTVGVCFGEDQKFSIGHLFRQSRTCHQKFQTKRGFLMKLIISFF